MSNDASRARMRRIADRIRSRKISDGAYSVFGRLIEGHIEAVAAAIADNYPTTNLDEEGLRRAVLLHETRYPQPFRTSSDVTAALQTARLNEQKKIIVRDITKQLLNKLSPFEKLNFVNSGALPSRYVVKGPNDE